MSGAPGWEWAVIVAALLIAVALWHLMRAVDARNEAKRDELEAERLRGVGSGDGEAWADFLEAPYVGEVRPALIVAGVICTPHSVAPARSRPTARQLPPTWPEYLDGIR